MARIPTTQSTVLERVVARIIEAVPPLNATTCFLSLDPEPDQRLSQNLFCTVSPMGGEFDQGALAGGGFHTPFENSGVIVSVWSAMALDRPEHAAKVLNDATRGLLRIKRKLLRALTGHDLLDADGNGILIDLMAPLQAQHPRAGSSHEKLTGFSLTFSTNFEWDLSDD
jgi:hypothetical protein